MAFSWTYYPVTHIKIMKQVITEFKDKVDYLHNNPGCQTHNNTVCPTHLTGYNSGTQISNNSYAYSGFLNGHYGNNCSTDDATYYTGWCTGNYSSVQSAVQSTNLSADYADAGGGDGCA